MRLHDLGSISAGKTPDDITCSITHMSSDRVIAQVDIIDECLLQNGDEIVKSIREQQTTSAEFSQREAASVPLGVGTTLIKQLEELLDYLVSKVFLHAHRNAAYAFGGSPADYVFIVFQSVQ